MSRTVLAEVDGFTPLLDCLVKEYGMTTAAVFGRVWRYCQMKDETCYAATATLGEELGLSAHTISTHLDKLVNGGYLEEIQRSGKPSLFRDTGKAGMTIQLTGGPIQKLDRTYTKIGQPPIQNLDTKIVVKKGKKDTGSDGKPRPPVRNLFAIAKALSEVTGLDFDKNKGRLFKEAKSYKDEDVPEIYRVYTVGGEWYTRDWRGKKGERPRVDSIRETWGQLSAHQVSTFQVENE